MATTITDDRHPAPLKVIGVGLGRTGTLSLHSALELLGFGPCHHPVIHNFPTHEMGRFAEATKNPLPEVLDELYRGYVSAVDNTAAMLAGPLYKAFPDAKFILTVREPLKWVQSMTNTTFVHVNEVNKREARIAAGTATEKDRIISQKLRESGIAEWFELSRSYHRNRLMTDPEGEYLRHNEYIQQLIPEEQLLVFNVAQGWKPLCEFLGVPEPKEPFPHLNDSAQLQAKAKQWLEKWAVPCTN